MALYEQPRFRITTWPREPARLPRPEFTKAMQYATSDGSRLVAGGVNRWRNGKAHPGFGELYLDVIRIDLENEAAVIRFVEDVDCLGVHSPEWMGEGDYEYFGPSEAVGFADRVVELRSSRDRASAGVAGTPSPALRKQGVKHGEFLPGSIETYDEFCFGARLLADLVTAWRGLTGAIPPLSVQWASQFLASETDDWTWASLPGATRLLGETFRSALRPFSPRFYVLPDGPDAELIGPHGRMSDDIPLFSILCLELFNHICGEIPYSECENERCRRLFVRQRGRAIHGQHRTSGVKYCSAECARAQAQRAYRRRRAAVRKQV
jgi:hypothetical protein